MKNQENSHTRTERRDAAENRKRILEAARILFEQNGVENVSMNQIAQEAEVGSGTLYRRYSNKGELCHDLIKNHIQQLFVQIDNLLEEKNSDSASERLKGVLHLFIQFREQKTQLLKGVEDYSPSNKSLVKRPLYQKLHQTMIDLLEDLHQFSEEEIIFRTDLLLTTFTSDAYLFQRDVRGYSPEEIVEHLYATLFS